MASTSTPEQKVILVGDFNVGKSSIFRRYMCDTFVNSNDRKATLGKNVISYLCPLDLTDKCLIYLEIHKSHII
jgi:GTPase SAR1 family protein